MEQFTNSQLPDQPRESWKVMFEHLYADMSALFQKERLLLRTELGEKIGEIKTAGTSFVIGGSLLLVGLFALVATAIILLAKVMDLGMAAGLVTSILFVVGGLMVIAAKKKLTTDKMMPTQSIETMNEIKSTFKERINEYRVQH